MQSSVRLRIGWLAAATLLLSAAALADGLPPPPSPSPPSSPAPPADGTPAPKPATAAPRGAEHNIELYVILALFALCVIGVGVQAWRRVRKMHESELNENYVPHKKADDKKRLVQSVATKSCLKSKERRGSSANGVRNPLALGSFDTSLLEEGPATPLSLHIDPNDGAASRPRTPSTTGTGTAAGPFVPRSFTPSAPRSRQGSRSESPRTPLGSSGDSSPPPPRGGGGRGSRRASAAEAAATVAAAAVRRSKGRDPPRRLQIALSDKALANVAGDFELVASSTNGLPVWASASDKTVEIAAGKGGRWQICVDGNPALLAAHPGTWPHDVAQWLNRESSPLDNIMIVDKTPRQPGRKPVPLMLPGGSSTIAAAPSLSELDGGLREATDRLAQSNASDSACGSPHSSGSPASSVGARRAPRPSLVGSTAGSDASPRRSLVGGRGRGRPVLRAPSDGGRDPRTPLGLAESVTSRTSFVASAFAE